MYQDFNIVMKIYSLQLMIVMTLSMIQTSLICNFFFLRIDNHDNLSEALGKTQHNLSKTIQYIY